MSDNSIISTVMSRINFGLFIIIILVSCTSKKQDMNKMVNDFADIECRAVLLREKRFALANEIRFTQDTLINSKNQPDTARLSARLLLLNNQKESLLQASLALADSIKNQLDSLTQNQLSKQDDKLQFNQMLNSTLKARGCN